MARNVLAIVLTIYLSLKYASSDTGEDVAPFVESVSFEYNSTTGEWHCGGYKCPKDTFGCKIGEISTDKEELVHQYFVCLDNKLAFNYGESVTKKVEKIHVVNINLKTYVGAKSNYTVDYLSQGDYAVGFVAVDDLPQLKEDFRNSKYSKSS